MSTATKGVRTRRRLLDAAAAEVARHGAARASLTQIAVAAGLKTGSIYFHFASKDELIETMLADGLRETLRYLDDALAAVPDAADARGRLRAAIRAHLDALHELNDYAAVVLALDTAADGPAAAEYHRLRRVYGRQWIALIEDAQRAGVLTAAVDPRTVRELIVGAMNAGLVGLGPGGRSPAETATALEALLGLGG
ncbi:TetR family transcriptional regulator [Pseudonocardia sp. GCM10023141]|uniref:TetR family transcriptional regulator n=1 Tax=Pseudonocardia sp. GCM10023141 TaxID=3252653 RepID=UPI0036153749